MNVKNVKVGYIMGYHKLYIQLVTYTSRLYNNILHIGTPEMLSDVSSSELTSTTVLISWSITTETVNRPVDHIIVQYHTSTSSDVVNVSADMTSVTLEGLIPNTFYTYTVTASNFAGTSPASGDQGFITPIGGEVTPIYNKIMFTT